MTEQKILTIKVTKPKGFDLAKPENKKALLAHADLIPYIGKTLKIQILEVIADIPKQGAEITKVL